MIINNEEIMPGENRTITVNIARLPSSSPIDISVTVSRAIIEGPVLLISGGLHGDEINGTEIVRRLIRSENNIPLIGTTICIPIINIYGFIHFSRYVPDGKDVNRSFPGKKSGSLAARVAYYLTKDILPKIDYGIDLHTGGADRTNYSQVRGIMSDPVNFKLAHAFYAPFTMNASYRPKSLRQTANKMGKHIIVYEGGESARFDEFAIKIGFQGTLRLMNFLGMTNKKPEPDYDTITISHTTWIRAKSSGLFQTAVKNGQSIKKNQVVGHITDPFGNCSIAIKSPASGYVIGLNNNPIVHQGDAMMHIGW